MRSLLEVDVPNELKRMLAVGCLALSACGEAETPSQVVVRDEEWLALVDSDDAGSDTFDEEPRRVRLSEFSAQGRPGTKLIMLVGAAGWCAPCQVEAAALSAFAADYEGRGVVVLTALIQDADSQPAELEFAKRWASTFSLTVPTLIDSKFVTADYFDLAAMPSTLIIDATNFNLRQVVVGADTGPDPLAKYRKLLDHYLSES
ncbi:MAG TPA: redoxin domain-containing protein [Polyangiaceae bacterium]|nr:redoxin domain-containing protein [Polyangiaceae bacterium]